jgi:hypothetical protein
MHHHRGVHHDVTRIMTFVLNSQDDLPHFYRDLRPALAGEPVLSRGLQPTPRRYW